jgi:hypothetical protein
MAITATFQIEPALISHVVSQIHEASAAEPGLTPEVLQGSLNLPRAKN